MTKRLLRSLIQIWLKSCRRSPSAGFTLLEVLIVALIAGAIVSGLLFMIVQLLTADQQESSRTETQREMQLAMDFIASELREAVYVYTGSCLRGTTATPTSVRDCPGLPAYLPASLSAASTSATTGSVPVLAFWRQNRIPRGLQERCRTETTIPTVGGVEVPCVSGHSYALVVYSLSLANPSNTWQGEARITRYMLEEFQRNSSVSSETAPNSFVRTPGYVNPSLYGNIFDSWPWYGNASNTIVNMQLTNGGRPTGNPQVLVDYVDDGRVGTAVSGTADDNPIIGTGTGATLCDPLTGTPTTAPFEISPHPEMLNRDRFRNVRSFYACVSRLPTTQYREVQLFLRGNANGRPGVGTDAFLPTLETRVLSRAVLERTLQR
ncbi:MAG TPA: prepilin-type N-terminal cleavage/methylation domain-containing protein [Synechococcales cyanobacterium M55_K2018_004]|nr:prepilin-type N-terminal cleavage/methylation domain-containing protein [Synechococcales cyanobacterium M55_K2018_004]